MNPIFLSPELMTYLPRLALAVVLSGVIGWERETGGKAAGFRTHVLFGLGTALFMLLGLEVARLATDSAAEQTARVFAGLVQGIGFLGAGVILREAGEVRGLTTAAGLWTVAAVAVASALGAYLLAVIATLLALVTLRLLKLPEQALESRRRRLAHKQQREEFE
ncbi:MAG: methyltransferase [Chloroflexota bacterium]|jgi:putative Mg2+ transporter-C (MgtC) family protein